MRFAQRLGKKQRERKMVQRTVRYGVIMATIVILISFLHYNDAQAKTRTAGGLACGQQLKQQCAGVPVQANNMLECLQKSQEKLHPRCVALANNVVRSCEQRRSATLPSCRRGSGQHSWMSDNRQAFGFPAMQHGSQRAFLPAVN
jgi:hypothetical protein